MNFFKALKAQHIALLITQPQKTINWRLFGWLVIIMFLSGGVLYGLFGDQILAEINRMFVDQTGEPFPIHLDDAWWILIAVSVFDIIGETMWMALVAFLTMRVLTYLKMPLRFRHVFNIYLLTRVYEVLVMLALLLGWGVVTLFTGATTLPLLQEDPGIAGVIVSFIIPVYFFWVYLWSVRFVAKQMMTLSSMQKEHESASE
jgi:hypothetical protein